MLKQIVYIALISFVFQAARAQKQASIWYFGEHAGLDFSSGAPIPLLDGQLNTNEGVASIADADGNLLFYTDGSKVFNKNHEVMLNGSGLLGDYTSSQSAVIVPKPASANMYYIFTVAPEGSPNGFCYSEVNMELEAGFGAVTANKNIPLLGQCTEQVTAVLHANAMDIWVITHGFGNNAFHAYLVSAAGVNEDPVTSNEGVAFPTTLAGAVGCMKASPQGDKIAISNHAGSVQLLDFDP